MLRGRGTLSIAFIVNNTGLTPHPSIQCPKNSIEYFEKKTFTKLGKNICLP